MSYLSSILDSIGSDGAPAASVAATAPAPRAPPASQKRKADSELISGPAKRPTTPANAQNGAPQRPTTPSSTKNGTAPKPRPVPLETSGVYAGSAKAAATGIVKQASSKAQTSSIGPLAVAKPVPKPATAAPKPLTPTGNKPAPKKGSYADMIARAKAAQASKAPVGVITHKQAEKVDPKARKVEAVKAKTGGPRDKKTGDRSRTGSAEIASKPGERVKQRPKTLEKSSYKGSAQPTTPVYTGSSRPGQNKPVSKRYDGYAGTDDEIDDYDEEDDYGYDDDESDMEAGAEDVWAEEEAALRQAKKDDAAELAYETKLKREKEARKRKALEDLAASRRKK